MTRHWRGAALAAIVAAGIALRVVALDRLPGINGDEAWYAVNSQVLLSGQTPFYRTPSGNIVNPVHSGVVLVLVRFLEPSPTVLRIPAAFWGSLAVLAAFPLLAAPLGRTVALIVTLIVAVSPPAVIQSRIGWDPSGAVPLTLLAVAMALRGHVIPSVLAGMTAILVHPPTFCWARSWPPVSRHMRGPATPPRTRRAGVACVPRRSW